MTSPWKHNVRRNFEAHIEEYDRHAPVQDKTAQKLAGLLPALAKPSVLEIGCGTGALTKRLLPLYKDGAFHITDISPPIVARTQEALLQHSRSRVRWSAMDGEDPPATHSYDLIVSNMALQWFENPAQGLENLSKILNPGGQIFYAVPGPFCFKEWREVLDMLDLHTGLLDFTPLPGVLEEEQVPLRYNSGLDVLRGLKMIGAALPKPDHTPLTPAALRKACRLFDERFKGRVTWHTLYGSIEAAQ